MHDAAAVIGPQTQLTAERPQGGGQELAGKANSAGGAHRAEQRLAALAQRA
jgi:hypothetical protein